MAQNYHNRSFISI